MQEDYTKALSTLKTTFIQRSQDTTFCRKGECLFFFVVNRCGRAESPSI